MEMEVLKAVPQNIRRLMTPLVALAVHHEKSGQSTQQAFKLASATCRSSCKCCLLRNRKGCCTGRSQLERASVHGCLFCTNWILLGFGSVDSLAQALCLSTDEEVSSLLRSVDAGPPKPCFAGIGVEIPKCIHQIWIGPREPPCQWMESWRVDFLRAHADWTYRLWRDDDITDVLLGELAEAFKALPHWCIKADLARYAILLLHGGIYVDADAVWLGTAGFEAMQAGRECIMALENTPAAGYGSDERIANSVIGLPPAHPLMSTLAAQIAEDYIALCDFFGERRAYLSDFRVCHRLTGPAALSRSFSSLGMPQEILLPSHIFYPVPWWKGQSMAMTDDETRAAHPHAITTHYGYSTNRLGGEEPSAVTSTS